MARAQKEKTDKEKWSDFFPVSSEELPDWASEQFSLDKENCSCDAFNPVEARALYISQFGDESHTHLLELLIAGEEAAASANVGDAFEAIDFYYPKEGLKKGEKVTTGSDEAKARARFLRLCLPKILRHFSFPAVIRNDIEILLAGYSINVDQKKKAAQRVLMAHPKLSYGAISKLINAEHQFRMDKSDLSQWVKADVVIDPHKNTRPSDPKRGRGTLPSGPPQSRFGIDPQARGKSR